MGDRTGSHSLGDTHSLGWADFLIKGVQQFEEEGE